MDKNEIQRVKTMNHDELLEELGRHVVDSTEYGISDLKEKALQWLESKRGLLYQAICAPDRWPAIRLAMDSTNIDDILAISWDVWLGPQFAGMPVCTIMKLLVEEGLDQFCGLEK